MPEWVEDTDPTLPEVDGHTWLRPAPAPCENCMCCSAALCEAGREHPFGCGGKCGPEDYGIVYRCPCSGEDAEGSAAYRSAVTRAERRATEMPIRRAAEQLLAALAGGGRPDRVSSEDMRILSAFRYVLVQDGGAVVTAAGRAYVKAMWGRTCDPS